MGASWVLPSVVALKGRSVCPIKDQDIVNQDYIHNGSYVAIKEIEFNHHKQQTWLDKNNDQRSNDCDWKWAIGTIIAILASGATAISVIPLVLKYFNAATAGNSTIT